MKIEEVLNRMRGTDNKIYPYNPDDIVGVWQSWYKGKSAFHTYMIYNGKNPVKMSRKSLNMAKRACEDWANLLLNEKTEITLSDALSNENLEEIFDNTGFWTKINGGLEKSFALGEGAIVAKVDVDVTDKGQNTKTGEIGILFFNRTKIYPLTIENGRTVECAFVQVDEEKVKVSIHQRGEHGTYEIINAVASGKDMASLVLDEDSIYSFDTRSKDPLFMILKPNIQNNIDIDSPYGISIFANAIDIMESIDLVFDSETNEYSLGRKRIFVSTPTDTTVDPVNGKQEPVFDSNDVVYYVLPNNIDGKNLIQDSTQPLRIEEHEKGIQANLNRFSAAVGFGNNRYKYDQGSVATATQVISENSDMFRNIQKHETLLRDELISFVKAIMRIANEFTAYSFNEASDIVVTFDDSIIEDKESRKASDRLDVAQRIMSKEEYRAKWYGEDEETARAKIAEIDVMTIPDDMDESGDGQGV